MQKNEKNLEKELTKAKVQLWLKESELDEHRRLLGVTRRSSNEDLNAVPAQTLIAANPTLKAKPNKSQRCAC